MCAIGVRFHWVSYLTNDILQNGIDVQDRNQDFHYGSFLLLLALEQLAKPAGIDLLPRDPLVQFLVAQYEDISC